MEGRTPEFMPNMPEKTDDGFSEARSAKIVEGKGMDTKQVKKRKPVISSSSRILNRPGATRPVRQRVRVNQSIVVSRKERIVAVYKENSYAIISLVEQLNAIDGTNFRQEEQVIEEIRKRRHLQEELLNALVLEQRHQLTEEAISKEAWNLIK